ncbi:MAG: MaoC family dehydratase [Pseudomonadota bacterium]
MKANGPRFAALSVGDELPPVQLPPLTRQTLAIYCGASGDHNPIHVDSDFAKESGLDDVIAHGMLVMSYMGRVVSDWAGQQAMRSFDTRFINMTRIGDQILASGRIAEKFTDAGQNYVRIELSAADLNGETKTTGTAVVAISD